MRIPDSSLLVALAISAGIHAMIMANGFSASTERKITGANQPRLVVSLQQPLANDTTDQPTERPVSGASPGGQPLTKTVDRDLGVADPYLPAQLLDELPEIIDDIPIDPPALRDRPEGGEAVLKLWIGEKGTVDRVEVESASLPPAFIDEIRTSFYRAHFRPGVAAGISTKTRMRVAVSVKPLTDERVKRAAPSSELSGQRKND